MPPETNRAVPQEAIEASKSKVKFSYRYTSGYGENLYDGVSDDWGVLEAPKGAVKLEGELETEAGLYIIDGAIGDAKNLLATIRAYITERPRLESLRAEAEAARGNYETQAARWGRMGDDGDQVTEARELKERSQRAYEQFNLTIRARESLISKYKVENE